MNKVYMIINNFSISSHFYILLFTVIGAYVETRWSMLVTFQHKYLEKDLASGKWAEGSFVNGKTCTFVCKECHNDRCDDSCPGSRIDAPPQHLVI